MGLSDEIEHSISFERGFKAAIKYGADTHDKRRDCVAQFHENKFLRPLVMGWIQSGHVPAGTNIDEWVLGWQATGKPIKHGTAAGVKQGCVCDRGCKKFIEDRAKERKKKRDAAKAQIVREEAWEVFKTLPRDSDPMIEADDDSSTGEMSAVRKNYLKRVEANGQIDNGDGIVVVRLDQDLRRHGTRTTYNSGCHCDSCKAANAQYFEDRRDERKLVKS